MFRTELLVSCLATIDSFFSLFFTLPSDTVLSMPYMHWGQLGHACLILSRLPQVQHDTWDATYVASVLDPRATFLRIAHKIEEVNAAGGDMIPPRNLPAIYRSMSARLRELGETPKPGPAFYGDVGFGTDGALINDMFSNMLDMDYLY
jgi:hypothetical protein